MSLPLAALCRSERRRDTIVARFRYARAVSCAPTAPTVRSWRRWRIWARNERTPGFGQTLVLLVGAVFVLAFGLGVLGAFGKALLGKGRYQRAADLAAVSAARSMRDDFTRLFEPAVDERGEPNPAI